MANFIKLGMNVGEFGTIPFNFQIIIVIIISVMELGRFLTRNSLTYTEVSSKVYHDYFCQLGSSVSLPWVIYFEAFYLNFVSSFSCIPVICPKLVLFLTSRFCGYVLLTTCSCITDFYKPSLQTI